MIERIYNGINTRLDRYKPSTRLRKSNWYHNLFPHLAEYERLERNADIICLGSTPAKYAFDFNTQNVVKGYNLAICPETIFYDYQVLKNYHSYLKKGGMILFVLCPFTFLKDYYRNENGSEAYMNIRYYPILHRAMIDNFDIKLYKKWVLHPAFSSIKAFVRSFVDTPPSMSWNNTFENPDCQSISEQFCKERLMGWMAEFDLKDLIPEHIPNNIVSVIEGNVNIFKNINDFINERGYKATIIIPPLPSEMTSLLPASFVEKSLFEPVKKTGIPYISFYGDKDWQDRDYYQHGFLINTKGRKLLTQTVIERLLLTQ